jgi:hypothetical protein
MCDICQPGAAKSDNFDGFEIRQCCLICATRCVFEPVHTRTKLSLAGDSFSCIPYFAPCDRWQACHVKALTSAADADCCPACHIAPHRWQITPSPCAEQSNMTDDTLSKQQRLSDLERRGWNNLSNNEKLEYGFLLASVNLRRLDQERK